MNLHGNQEPSLNLINLIDQDDEMSNSVENRNMGSQIESQFRSVSIKEEEKREEVSFGDH